MPSRILKESICTSESLAYLSAEAEVLFYRLIVKADDFGLYYGSPKILASLLFPLNVPTEKKVSSWLAELVNGGLVATYRAEDGRQYLKLLSWDKHQNRRATKPKYPLPQEFDNTCSQEVSSGNSNTCAQMQADSSVRPHCLRPTPTPKRKPHRRSLTSAPRTGMSTGQTTSGKSILWDRSERLTAT